MTNGSLYPPNGHFFDRFLSVWEIAFPVFGGPILPEARSKPEVLLLRACTPVEFRYPYQTGIASPETSLAPCLVAAASLPNQPTLDEKHLLSRAGSMTIVLLPVSSCHST